MRRGDEKLKFPRQSRNLLARLDVALFEWRPELSHHTSLFFFRVLVVWVADLITFLRFMEPGLLKFQRIFVAPAEVAWGYASGRPPSHLGAVPRRPHSVQVVPVLEAQNGTVRMTVKRIETGSWERSGDQARLSEQRKARGKSHSWDDESFQEYVRQRYGALNELIEDAKEIGRLRTRSELEPRAFREKKGISVAVGQRGELILLDGHHRFGVALGLGLSSIPVSLVSVDPRFVEAGKWKTFYRDHRSPTGHN